EHVRQADPTACLINHPGEVLLRAELLRATYDADFNDFRAIPAAAMVAGETGSAAGAARRGDGGHEALRYPVFIREANEHRGSLTGLLPDVDALDHALIGLRVRGYPLATLLVVEFCETADIEGIYRKYSAFVVGDRILPRYLNASRTWMVKQEARVYEMNFADQELRYLAENPHEDWLRTVFGLARIGYGRIDYAVRDGRPQLWEINTNPTIGRAGRPRIRPPEAERYRERIAPARARFYEAFRDAWKSIDSPAIGTIPFEPPPSLLGDLMAEQAARGAGWQRAFVGQVSRWTWARRLAHGLEPIAARTALRMLRILRRPG
ncbi:MAG: hypothetical protein ACRELX_19015, partial [Longimicrobiales bacterium]